MLPPAADTGRTPPSSPQTHGIDDTGGTDDTCDDGYEVTYDVTCDGGTDAARAAVRTRARAGTPPDRWAARLARALSDLPDLDRRAVAGLVVLLLLAVGYGVQHFRSARPRSVPVPSVAVPGGAPGPIPAAAALAPSGPGPVGALPRPSPGPAAQVVVDVSGKVRRPGLRTLPRGSRVADALRAAGGPRRGADTTGLNLARVLVDGEQILVGASAAPGSPAAPPPPGAAGGRPTVPVSLNTASAEQLDSLPGVGPVLAGHIVEYREAHGGFTALDQLQQVAGIGARKYADLRPLVTL
ncbi:helix-hairpin-helix domain-containing protein [Streptomyces sp. NPDC001380]|uniref:helix-hairpin-helix domain-containing protein n=1 Tax=Streptomyces sp. NPDC001380 TaxID=3364566 RepID=UPI0036CD1E33